VVLQASAVPGEVAVFLYDNGVLAGPVGFSTLGMRIQNEQSGSTSLFAHPVAIEAIPESEASGTPAVAEAHLDLSAPAARLKSCPDTNQRLFEDGEEAPSESGIAPVKLARGVLEARLETVLAALADRPQPPSATLRQGHLALLKRWYYRPEGRRSGEIFFPDAQGRWPAKAVLRGVGRVAAKTLETGNQAE
jgi:hypothetical protein